MTLGVTIGKFNPFHVGHDHLIATAKAQVDELIVFIGVRAGETVPAHVRAEWIRELHPDVTVIETVDDLPEAPQPWAQRVVDTLGRRPDVAFTSEAYGDPWAAAMGAVHVCVDPGRLGPSASGRLLRADVAGGWHLLTPPAKAHLARRVCVLGVESSGTTTLAQDLAAAFGTVWVPEYGRLYWEGRRFLDSGWTTAELVHIATQQQALEDALARRCNRLVVCDTDALATAVWHRRYVGSESDEVTRIALSRAYELYLLTAPDFGFVQDGSRDGEHIRLQMHDWFVAALDRAGRRYEIVTGPRAQRLATAAELVGEVLTFPVLQ